jgi:hypothetical protein
MYSSGTTDWVANVWVSGYPSPQATYQWEYPAKNSDRFRALPLLGETVYLTCVAARPTQRRSADDKARTIDN